MYKSPAQSCLVNAQHWDVAPMAPALLQLASPSGSPEALAAFMRTLWNLGLATVSRRSLCMWLHTGYFAKPCHAIACRHASKQQPNIYNYN